LGKQLKVDDHLMNIIEYDHPNDCATCCGKMLTEWLDNIPNASWEDLTTAVTNLSSYGMCVVIMLLFILLNVSGDTLLISTVPQSSSSFLPSPNFVIDGELSSLSINTH